MASESRTTLQPSDVTACLVTRGDQPEAMAKIIDSLIFDRVIVWDNSDQPDWKVAGRYMAAMLADTDWVYWQDDDCLVPPETQEQLCAEAGEEDIVANWGHGENPDGYDDLPLVCGGAVAFKWSAWDCIARYGAVHPLDTAFQYEADFVVGALYRSWRHVDLPFHIDLSIAQAPERLCNQPFQKALKYEVTQRARAIRDSEKVAA